jgi:hypothetical protein
MPRCEEMPEFLCLYFYEAPENPEFPYPVS